MTRIKCEVPSEQAISIVSEAYEPSSSSTNKNGTYIVEGNFTGQVTVAPSRHSASSGKIDLKGAARQAQVNKHRNNDKKQTSDDQVEDDEFMIHIKAKEIEVRTMSWMDVIKAKHGFS